MKSIPLPARVTGRRRCFAARSVAGRGVRSFHAGRAASGSKARRRKRRQHTVGKGIADSSLFANGIFTYVENPKKST